MKTITLPSLHKDLSSEWRNYFNLISENFTKALTDEKAEAELRKIGATISYGINYELLITFEREEDYVAFLLVHQ